MMLLILKGELAISGINVISFPQSSGIRVYEVLYSYTLFAGFPESIFENHQLLLSKHKLSHRVRGRMKQKRCPE